MLPSSAFSGHLWAMTRQERVVSFIARSSADCTCASEVASSALVACSKVCHSSGRSVSKADDEGQKMTPPEIRLQQNVMAPKHDWGQSSGTTT